MVGALIVLGVGGPQCSSGYVPFFDLDTALVVGFAFIGIVGLGVAFAALPRRPHRVAAVLGSLVLAVVVVSAVAAPVVLRTTSTCFTF